MFPIGFADRDRDPRFPQEQAEIMGGRVPLSPEDAAIPRGLKHVVIGPETALEIRLID